MDAKKIEQIEAIVADGKENLGQIKLLGEIIQLGAEGKLETMDDLRDFVSNKLKELEDKAIELATRQLQIIGGTK